MRSAVAELIAAFLQDGGVIQKCRDGIGLGEPVLQRRYRTGEVGTADRPIGMAARDAQERKRICAKILAVLGKAEEPMTLLGIEKAVGASFDSVRRAVDALALDGAITFTQAAARQTRWFSLAQTVTGAGNLTGGPASESAAGACAGANLTHAARPGKAA